MTSQTGKNTPPAQAFVRNVMGANGNIYRLLIVMLIIFTIMSIANPQRFLTYRNFTSMGFQFPELGLFALAIMMSLISGGIDLSVIATANLAGITAALIMTRLVAADASGIAVTGAVLAATAAAVLTGAACGAFNGWLISRVRITPILATLGTMQLYTGFCYALTKGHAIHGYPNGFLAIGNGTVGPLPAPFIVFTIAALATAVILNKTALGERLSLTGANETAAIFSGINVRSVLLKTYMVSGLLAALAGIVMIARTNSARVDYGSSYLLQAVLVAILAGVDPKGGFGSVTGILVAVISLQFLSSGFSMMRYSNFAQEFAWGALLLLVMTINFACNKIADSIKEKKAAADIARERQTPAPSQSGLNQG